LDPEITYEARLGGTCGSQAAAGHKQENYRGMDLVAEANIESGLVERRLEGALIVELNVPFELFSEIVAGYQAGDPTVRSASGRRCWEA
jgi:hypothetical protein